MQLRLDLVVRAVLQSLHLVDEIGIEVAVILDRQCSRRAVGEHVDAADRRDRENAGVMQIAKPPSNRQHQRQRGVDRDRAQRNAPQQQAERDHYKVRDRHRPDQHQHAGEHAGQWQFARVHDQREDNEKQRGEERLRQNFVRVMQRRRIDGEEDGRADGNDAVTQSPHYKEIDRNRQRDVQQVLKHDHRHDPQSESRQQQRIAGRPQRLDQSVRVRESESVDQIARRLEIRERVGEKVVVAGECEVEEVRGSGDGGDNRGLDPACGLRITFVVDSPVHPASPSASSHPRA